MNLKKTHLVAWVAVAAAMAATLPRAASATASQPADSDSGRQERLRKGQAIGTGGVRPAMVFAKETG